jgi:hypothetical protein
VRFEQIEEPLDDEERYYMNRIRELQKAYEKELTPLVERVAYLRGLKARRWVMWDDSPAQ